MKCRATLGLHFAPQYLQLAERRWFGDIEPDDDYDETWMNGDMG